MKVLWKYQKTSGRRITFEYILINNLNDTIEEAKKLNTEELKNLIYKKAIIINDINISTESQKPMHTPYQSFLPFSSPTYFFHYK